MYKEAMFYVATPSSTDRSLISVALCSFFEGIADVLNRSQSYHFRFRFLFICAEVGFRCLPILADKYFMRVLKRQIASLQLLLVS